MKYFLFLTLLSFGFSQMALAEDAPKPMEELLKELREKRDTIRTWAPFCEDGTQSHGLCPFGDMTIFSGISCLSGETERCNDVKNAQGPDGRWWRSPQLVGNDNEINTFSRDQAKGALSYLIATKDVGAALRWQAYLESHNKRMCPKSKDNRCVITLGTSQLFGAVWEYLGLTPAKWMNRGKWLTHIYDPIEALIQSSDFPMHLTALNAWMRVEIERRGGPATEKVARKSVKIIARREPGNPFYKLLRDGPTAEVANIILSKCPDTRPLPIHLDWAWQRSQKQKNNEQPVWLHASGHDCIFIINVFERELTLRDHSE
jgi:hypothetical protein